LIRCFAQTAVDTPPQVRQSRQQMPLMVAVCFAMQPSVLVGAGHSWFVDHPFDIPRF
jgi:hypothetical protein